VNFSFTGIFLSVDFVWFIAFFRIKTVVSSNN